MAGADLLFRKFMHDTDVYTDPFVFDPTRFLSDNGRTPEHDPRDYCFGFGRRFAV